MPRLFRNRIPIGEILIHWRKSLAVGQVRAEEESSQRGTESANFMAVEPRRGGEGRGVKYNTRLSTEAASTSIANAPVWELLEKSSCFAEETRYGYPC